jgi:hypothetical protein
VANRHLHQLNQESGSEDVLSSDQNLAMDGNWVAAGRDTPLEEGPADRTSLVGLEVVDAFGEEGPLGEDTAAVVGRTCSCHRMRTHRRSCRDREDMSAGVEVGREKEHTGLWPCRPDWGTAEQGEDDSLFLAMASNAIQNSVSKRAVIRETREDSYNCLGLRFSVDALRALERWTGRTRSVPKR